MNTGIKELDRLLGYQPEMDQRRIGSIPIGSVILIRGQPGSGKTTLALQIIDKYLAIGQRRAAFISLESDPQRTVDRASSTFKFKNLKRSNNGKVHNLVELGQDDLWEALGEFSKDSSAEFALKFIECIEAKFPSYNKEDTDETHADTELLILVDSLLPFADIASRKLQDGHNIRSGLNCIRDCAKSQLQNAYLIYTCEYHQQQSLINESFCCDIEILLSPEPIAGGMSRPVDSFSPIGYSIERCTSGSNSAQAIISRSFCRVLKHRGWPNHSRRCAYDMVDGQGIIFYETYPGDGQIVLFSENERQNEVWAEFFDSEVPYRYPSIRFLTFDRSGLQRTFASQRGLKHMPERVDLYLTSLDTYWVNWYVEFCQRGDIFGFLQQYFPEPTDAMKSYVPQVICRIHELCLTPTDNQPAVIAAITETIVDYLATNNLPLNDVQKSTLQICAKDIVSHFAKPDAYTGMLTTVKRKHLRLFGEHRSELIEPFNRPNSSQRSPAHYSNHDLNSARLLSIPYDANVSFMIYRKDLLIIKDAAEATKLEQNILKIFHEQRGHLDTFLAQSETKNWLEKEANAKLDVKCFDQKKVEQRVARLVQRLKLGFPPSTWEEVIALCELKNLECLIETRTFDTFATTFLELLWNCGGDLEITPSYKIKNRANTTQRLFQAICFLHKMFHSQIIPKKCSVDPSYMNRRFCFPADQTGKKKPGWLFARHWYSTCVDLLTRKSAETGNASSLTWFEPEAKVEIMPIPISLFHYLEQEEHGKVEADIVYTSCWGEWHLAIHRGSENKTLALDLINNLMSSSKICDRAFRNAALPTVQQFYERYGKVNCLNVPERVSNSIPSWTFNKINDKLFRYAKSRSQIFDYRHCMREIHAVLESLEASPGDNPLAASSDLLRALGTITEFSSKGLMLS